MTTTPTLRDAAQAVVQMHLYNVEHDVKARIVPEEVQALRAALAAPADTTGLAHEIWAVAQLGPGEGIEDGAARVEALLVANSITAAAPADALAEPVAPDADAEDPGLFRHFDGMCWPVPGEFSAELEWRARHSHSALPMGDRVCLASIVSAYAYLISLPAKDRDKIIRELRKGPQLPPAAAAIRAKGQQK